MATVTETSSADVETLTGLPDLCEVIDGRIVVDGAADVGDHVPDSLYEVIDGRIVGKSMSAFEVTTATTLIERLTAFLLEHRLGRVHQEMLILIDATRQLKLRPDLAFVSKERWPIRKQGPRTEAWDMIPDLAIEVISRSNGAGEMMQKMLDYRRAGVRLVWHVYPVQEVVLVFESSGAVRLLKGDDILDGGDVLPGFGLPLADLFADDETTD